ncbi:MAG: N-acetylmuramoyl-L-alanine amidase [Firmicutes bacterium]|nr:N-acetylmuramoyl-L-alanine amidase [Bacillota bacterium]
MKAKRTFKRILFILGVILLPIIFNSNISAYEELTTGNIIYRSYINYRWLPWVNDGDYAGILGKKMAAFQMKLGSNITDGSIKYRGYITGSGWEAWKNDTNYVGASNKTIEAFNIILEGTAATKYDIYYSVYVDKLGWMGWAKNGENAGTNGYGYLIEGIKVKVVAKGAAAPGSTTGAYVSKTPVVSQNVTYRSYINYKWLPWTSDGAVSGEDGRIMSAFQMDLGSNITDGSIKYRGYITGSGWEAWKDESNYVGAGSKKIEAFNIVLEGTAADNYDIYYSVNVDNLGWLGWAKNGENAGTSGYEYQIEQIKVVVVAKGAAAPGSTTGAYVSKTPVVSQNVTYRSYINYKWLPWTSDGAVSGEDGRMMSAFQMDLGSNITDGSIKYRGYITGSGWEAWKDESNYVGAGSKKIEAFNIVLEGTAADNYDIYYSVNVDNLGWLGWAKNGENAGTSGYEYQIEQIKVVVVAKGAAAPGSTTGAYVSKTPVVSQNVTYRSYINYKWLPWTSDGAVSGEDGRMMSAFQMDLGSNITDGSIKYRGYITGSGWEAWKDESNYVGAGNKKIEAFNIVLEGTAADNYDIYYSVNVDNLGWLGWAKNGENAGTSGYEYQIEQIKVVVVTKGAVAPGSTTGAYVIKPVSTESISYRSYINYKWLPWTSDGAVSGEDGRMMSAFQMDLGSKIADGSIKYRGYITGSGWEAWKDESNYVGAGNKKIEAFNIVLEGTAADNYDIYYSVNVDNLGWLGWAKNGENAGTSGYGYQIEQIKVLIVAKGAAAPGSTTGAYRQPLLESMAGETIYMQVQNGGGFLYSANGVLTLGRYNAISDKTYYEWRKIEYPSGSGNYVLQNLGDEKVLGSDLTLKDFVPIDGQFWSITQYPVNNLYNSYNVKNIEKNQNIDGILSSTNVATLKLATADASYDQKINFINTNESSVFNIMGTSTVSKESVKEYLISKIGATYYNSTSPIYTGSTITINQYYNQVLDAYYNIAPLYGVKPEVAIAQAFLETGYMKFGGLVEIGDFNFAGIYATGSAITEAQSLDLKGADPNKVELIPGDMAARFKSIEYGVEGHIHHLLAYATSIDPIDTNGDGVEEISGHTLASPRFNLVSTAKRNTGTILPGLNSQWAVPGYTYGQSIMNIIKDMKKFIAKLEVADGIYSIDSLYSGLRLDVNSASIINDVGLKQQTADNGNNQYWNIEMVSDDIYRIVSLRSGKALTYNGSKVVQDTWSGTDEQLWYFVDNGNEGVKICSITNDYTLALASSSKAVGIDIVLSTNVSDEISGFKLVSSSYNKSDLISETKAIKGIMDGVYNIKNTTNSRLINVPTQGSFTYVSPNPRNSIQLTSYTSNSTIAQKFKFVRLASGDYKIIGVNSGKLLSVITTTESSSVVQLYDKKTDAKQFWKIVSNGTGYLLKNVGTDKNMTVSSVSTLGSGLVQSSNTLNWTFTKLSNIPNFDEKTAGLAGKVIWIDPGHGSAYSGYYDPGAIGNGLREVDTNTLFANELANKLRAAGATVLLTRTIADPGLTIDNRQRSYMADEANTDIFISIHSNSSALTTAYGAETYYYAPDTTAEDPGYNKVSDQRIVNSIALANYIQPKMAAGGGFYDRGVKYQDFAVIRESAMPAVLVEIGFLSNASDATKIKNATTRTNTVNGIYLGIVEYFNNLY